MSKSTFDREQWLTEAAHMILDELITPALPSGFEIPHPFRVSVGYPPRSTARSKTIAVCIKAEASADLHNEIFITPSIDDSVRVLDCLTHELLHYTDNCASGHQNHFARMARRVGLEGKLTATHAGEKLAKYLRTVIDVLGDIPHAAIDLGIAKKKQTTRMVKVGCQVCGWSFRTSQKNVDLMQSSNCLCCNAPALIQE